MQEKGFFGSLFDISFRSFVATKIVSVLFVIALMLSALYTLFAIAAAFNASWSIGVVVTILAPAVYLLFVLYARVLLEFVVVVFRIYENTSILAAHASPTLQPPSAPGRQPSSGAQSPSE